MGLLYNFFVFLFYMGIRLAALFSPKAKKAINGRKNFLKELEHSFAQPEPTIWIHCASLGEFEQARPLIETIKTKKPQKRILLTFFSPSGYEAQKNYALADVVCYIPFDFKSHAKRFLALTQVECAIFVKYEFWFNFLTELKKKEVPTYLISGIFWPQQQFFKPYGKWFTKKLSAFNHFFVQNEQSKKLLEKITYSNVTISGDSRFDRVIKLPKENLQDNRLETFCAHHEAIIFGSSWPKEEKFAINAASQFPEEKIIVAPHEIKDESIQQLKTTFSNAILWSETAEDTDLSAFQVIIINQIGMLSKIYRFGKIAIIGGGFGAGIHNTLEAAVYGCPLLIGPIYHRFQEAHDLIACGAAKVIHNDEEFLTAIEAWLHNKAERLKLSETAKTYVKKNAGATEIIYRHIFPSES